MGKGNLALNNPIYSSRGAQRTRRLGVPSGGRLRGVPESNHHPGSSHSSPQILVSLDGQTAGHQESPPAPLPSGMESFESLCCVLGQQDVVWDCHCWAMKGSEHPVTSSCLATSSIQGDWICCAQDQSLTSEAGWSSSKVVGPGHKGQKPGDCGKEETLLKQGVSTYVEGTYFQYCVKKSILGLKRIFSICFGLLVVDVVDQ
ncbi:uncharacterized protein LOC143692217 isoform X3 [Agelaius phoeniceus]|uniref:uncharacterized protein LOC143692217 isoform X3 n=1 Tax=Agelaius phoeniceus TaxID=39638 RepID=UPI004054EC70